MENQDINSVDPKSNSSTPPAQPPHNPDLIPEIPPPVYSKPKTTNCKPDQTPFWKIILETAAVFVGLYVAGVYHGQLAVMQGQLGEIIKQYPEIKKTADSANTTLIEGRFTSAEQLRKLGEYIVQAQTANKIAFDANRAWIGSLPGPLGKDFPKELEIQEGHDASGAFVSIRYIWNFKNSGKRPGRIEKFETTGNSFYSCPSTPDYNFVPNVPVAFGPTHSHALVIPDTEIRSVFQTAITPDKWRLIQRHRLEFCIYSHIAYRDVGGDQAVLHHTTDCRILVAAPDLTGFAECDNGYANAD